MRNVFDGLVDYAGLFPPASLTMAESVRNYEAYRHGSDRWLLGRYVVAAMRLKELHETLLAEGIAPTSENPWRLTVVFGNVIPAEVKFVEAFRALRTDGSVIIDAVEFRVNTVGGIPVVAKDLPQDVEQYLEVPKDGQYPRLISAIRTSGARAKLRTGGSTPDLFPAPESVIAFIVSCVEEQVPFKFTAGLHHPFRGTYPLTYLPESESFLMYGFVPLFLATAQIVRDRDSATALQIIEEADQGAFTHHAGGYAWRGKQFSSADLAAARQFFVGFGSCSFTEPLEGIGGGVSA